MAAFNLHHHGRARTARYHRGFWVSNELSGVRAAMTNLCSLFFEPSNQSQTTRSPSTAVTVIVGPPELRRTVSPGLKGMFDIQTLPSHGIACAARPPQALAPPLHSEDIGTPRWQLAVKLHHFATTMEGPFRRAPARPKKHRYALPDRRRDPRQSAEERRTVRQERSRLSLTSQPRHHQPEDQAHRARAGRPTIFSNGGRAKRPKPPPPSPPIR